jgi:hypothetical protein
MFEGLKEKMNQIYDNVKNKIDKEDDIKDKEDTTLPKKINQPLIQKPNKPNTYGINNSLMGSELNDSDYDFQKLESFNVNLKSEKSVGDDSANRVSYYNKKSTPNPLKFNINGRIKLYFRI